MKVSTKYVFTKRVVYLIPTISFDYVFYKIGSYTIAFQFLWFYLHLHVKFGKKKNTSINSRMCVYAQDKYKSERNALCKGCEIECKYNKED